MTETKTTKTDVICSEGTKDGSPKENFLILGGENTVGALLSGMNSTIDRDAAVQERATIDRYNDDKSENSTPSQQHRDPAVLHALGIAASQRYRTSGNVNDLETAAGYLEAAVELTSRGDPERAGRLHSLAASLIDRYRRLGDQRNLDSAVQMNQEAVNLTPPGHAESPRRLRGLALSLTDRYHRLGELKDLNTAVQRNQEAMDLTIPGHPERPVQLQNLAVSLITRYRRLGNLMDLEAAQQKNQEAVDLTPLGHPDRPERLQSLAVSLSDRYQRLGDLKDLESALQSNQSAVDLTPPGHPTLPQRLQCLSGSLTDRYQRLGDLKDLQAAVAADRKVVDLTPPRHTERSRWLQYLSISLTDRYTRLGDLRDLEAALEADQEAVDLTPPGHAERPGRLQSLSQSLTRRYRELNNLEDLQAALHTIQEAVSLTSPGHVERSWRSHIVAVSLSDRYLRLKDPKDLEAIHANNIESFEHPSLAIPTASWEQALERARFAKEFLPSDCIPAFRAAFDLLPEILWLGHSIPLRHEKIHRLGIDSATSTAVQGCIKLSDLSAAVELLEQGLATIFQQMLQLKTDIHLLPPDQAEQLADLSSQLHSGMLSDPITVADARNKLLATIRMQPDFKHFLLPKSYDVLCQASKGGPVIILTSHKDQCDGIIILNPTSKAVHVLFPTVTLELLKSQREVLKDLLGHCNVRNRGQTSSSRLFGRQEQFLHKPIPVRFQGMLNWLWIHVIEPIYMALKSHRITNGRLWWLPTGAFAGLPLHASAPTDEFIHSYTATLGLLLDAYAKKPSSTVTKLALVGVTHTDSNGANTLRGVEQEVAKITSIVKKPHIESLVGEQATVEAVKLQLPNCSWLHLACHGHQDLVDPTKSHLMLYKGTLELDTILRMPLPNAEFVFLAACQTAMGDAELVNESFHLGGGFITAGFQSAIGTMWSMDDIDGPAVAETVYSHLFREGRQPQVTETAEALQLAVQELKQRQIPYERWVPFIHIGI
ncbi:CHAT domain-containing protein [Mycena galopus ATCC 62051]|nr:CHAT domain-containing protein [Mycena galopus ATCC 62051]